MIGLLDSALLPVILVAIATTTVLILVYSGIYGGPRKRLEVRARKVQARVVTAPISARGLPNVRLRNKDSSFASFDKIIKRYLPRPQELRLRLQRTGKTITIGEYVLTCVAVGAILGWLRTFLFPLPPALGVMLGIMIGVGLPHFYISILIKKRLKRFLNDFPDAIELIIRGVRSGLPVPESIRTVGNEFIGPVGQEFRIVADKLKLGQQMDQALLEAGVRINSPEFKFFVISLAVQRETGGNLAETLENLADLLRKRRQMLLKIRAMSSEARASAMILGSLPFIMFAIMYLLNPGYVMMLFNDPRGVVMTVAALASIAFGIFVMAKLARFEI